MALANFFDGKVAQEEFTQVVDLNTGTTGGYLPIFFRELVTREAVTQTFTFTGCSYDDAHSTAQVTVTDIGGHQYTFTPKSKVTDGSSGTKVFETESVQVRRRRISYHMWEVEVTRTGSRYLVNNSVIINGPSWAFP